MGYLDGPACRLWVEATGEGDPITVVAHGLASSSEDLGALTSYLPGRKVSFDFRGHGRSETPPPEAGYDHRAMREDLSFVAERFGATCAVGVSMGAGAIMNLLCDRPDAFARAVLVMPSRLDDPCPDPTGTLRFADQIETQPLVEIAEALLRLPHLAALLAREPRWREHIRAQILRINPEGVPLALRAYATGPPPVPHPERLRDVRADLLVAVHERDPNHPADVGRRIADLAPRATLRVWEDDFAMMLDDLDGFGALAAAFLSPVPA